MNCNRPIPVAPTCLWSIVKDAVPSESVVIPVILTDEQTAILVPSALMAVISKLPCGSTVGGFLIVPILKTRGKELCVPSTFCTPTILLLEDVLAIAQLIPDNTFVDRDWHDNGDVLSITAYYVLFIKERFQYFRMEIEKIVSLGNSFVGIMLKISVLGFKDILFGLADKEQLIPPTPIYSPLLKSEFMFISTVDPDTNFIFNGSVVPELSGLLTPLTTIW